MNDLLRPNTHGTAAIFLIGFTPIRKKALSVLRALYIERKNKYINKRGVWGVSPHTVKSTFQRAFFNSVKP